MDDLLLFRRPKRAILPAVPDGVRVYAIGDIHGRLDLFNAMLETIHDETSVMPSAIIQIVLLGDLIDRGPDSAGVVARAMRALEFAELLVLAGNHEAAMLDALDGDRDMLRLWMANGGGAALRSWGIAQEVIDEAGSSEIVAAARAAIPASTLAWLGHRPASLAIGDYFFVHAGVRPGVPLERQSRTDKLWIRDAFLNSRRHFGAMIVHGHSVSKEVDERDNRIGIDTGAYHSGRLTALVLEGTSRRTIATTGYSSED